jgi:hypothetical protein
MFYARKRMEDMLKASAWRGADADIQPGPSGRLSALQEKSRLRPESY